MLNSSNNPTRTLPALGRRATARRPACATTADPSSRRTRPGVHDPSVPVLLPRHDGRRVPPLTVAEDLEARSGGQDSVAVERRPGILALSLPSLRLRLGLLRSRV